METSAMLLVFILSIYTFGVKSGEVKSDAMSLGQEMLENPIALSIQTSTISTITHLPEKISHHDQSIHKANIFPLFNKYKATQLEDQLNKFDNSDILEINIPVIGTEFAASEAQIDPYDNGFTDDLDDRSQESMLEFKIMDNSTEAESGEITLPTTTLSPVSLKNFSASTAPNGLTTAELLVESTTKTNFWGDLKKEQKEAESLIQAINKVVIIPQDAEVDQETAKIFNLLAEKLGQKKNSSKIDLLTQENMNADLEVLKEMKQEEILEKEIFGSNSDIVNRYIKLNGSSKSEDALEKIKNDLKHLKEEVTLEKIILGASNNFENLETLENIQSPDEYNNVHESLENKVLQFIDNLKISTPQPNFSKHPIFEPIPYKTYSSLNDDLPTPRSQERVYRHQIESPNQQNSFKELTDELDKLIQQKMKEYAKAEVEDQIWLKNLEMNALNSRAKQETTTVSADAHKISSKKIFIANKNPHEILSSVIKKIKHSQINLGKNTSFNPQPSYKTKTDEQYNESMESSNESQENVQICKFGDNQKSNCVKRAASPQDLFPRIKPNTRLADWAKHYKVPEAIKRRQQETSMERINRVNTNLDKMMQFVSVVAHLDSFLTQKAKSTINKFASVYGQDQQPPQNIYAARKNDPFT